MAAEAQAEGPLPAPPSRPASPEKRALPGDGGEEEERAARPEPKRRRACVAALDSVPCAAEDGPGSSRDGDGASFSFQHAGGGFVALETTPKFGSFNPPSAAEQAALDLKPAQPEGETSPEAAAEVASVPAHGQEDEEEGRDEDEQVVEEVDGRGPEINHDSVLTSDQP